MSRLSDLFGKPTPVTVASWTCFVLGLVAAIAGGSGLTAHSWLGIGLILIGASMLIDLLPGGSRINGDQQVLVRHAGLGSARRAQRLLALLFGTVLTAAGAYSIWG